MRIIFLVLALLPVAAFSQNWLTTGNSGTSASNFIGTTDNQPLIFRANNTEFFRLSAGGNLLLGTTSTGNARATIVADVANNNTGLSVRQNSYDANKNIIEITNPGGVTISKFDHGGRLIMKNTGSATNPPFLMATRDLAVPPSFSTIPMVFIQPGAPDQSGIIVRSLEDQQTTSYLQDWQASNHTSLLRIMADGKLGIGVAAPAAQLHTSGTVRFAGLANDNAKTRVLVSDADGTISYRDASTIGGSGGSISGTNNYLAKYSGTTAIGNSIVFDNGTSVGIGTTSFSGIGYKLYVEDGIRTKKVKVDLASWADYVFEPDYKLPTLKEVEAFIRQNKHLPDVPSAKNIEEEGLDLGSNQAVLLKKIEELTLYVIELKKENDKQNDEITQLKKKMGKRK